MAGVSTFKGALQRGQGIESEDQMTTATVTVKFVNQPNPGKKMGSIKTSELGVIFVWPDKLSQFTPGNKYTIDYADEGGFKKLVKVGGTVVDNTPPASPTATTQEPPWEPPGNEHREYDVQECIFICGLINNAVASGKIDLNAVSIAALMSAGRQAWAQTFGK